MQRSNEIVISGIGTALPTHYESQQDIAEYLIEHICISPQEKRRLKKVYLSSGIEYRHSVINSLTDVPQFFDSPNHQKPCLSTKDRLEIYKNNALPLALQAVQACFDSLTDIEVRDKGKQPDKENSFQNKLISEITHLITVSCTGMYAPGLDIDITTALNLSTTVQRTCINFMGCYAVFNALKCAEAICQANPTAKVLIVSVELCTLHFQKVDSIDNLISSAIFSDGAGALLIQSTQSFQSAQYKALLLKDFYCDILVQGSKEMTWDIGNNGFDIILSTYVPNLINGGIKDFITKLFKKNNMNFKECNHFAIHPGGKKILEACEVALEISSENLIPSYNILRRCGNMSSATIIFVLKEIWDTLNSQHHDETIFSCAFGPGLTLESMLLKTMYV